MMCTLHSFDWRKSSIPHATAAVTVEEEHPNGAEEEQDHDNSYKKTAEARSRFSIHPHSPEGRAAAKLLVQLAGGKKVRLRRKAAPNTTMTSASNWYAESGP